MSALLFVSTFLASILQTETIVYAVNDKTITGLCTGAIGNPTSGAGGWSYVYYGTYSGNAMKYRVLDKAATQFNTNTTMLLDCDSTIENKQFASSSNVWANSGIRTWLNGNDFYGKASVFTAQEKAAIAISTKETPDTSDLNNKDGDGSQYLDYAPLSPDETHIDYIFLLDAVEATRPSYGYKNTNGDDATRSKSGTDNFWWLRSPYHDGGDVAGLVDPSGFVSIIDVNYGGSGVSPAFNLNLSSVIFSSLIPNTTNEYKLTVKDTNMTIAKTGGSDVTRDGNVVTVPYTISGTNSGEATQVSVLLTDSAYRAETVATTGYSYQKLNVTTWGTSGTGTFTLPAAYANKTCGTDYYAYILAEDVNTGNATDYASTPATITIPDAIAEQVATPTFSPAAGTYATAQNVEIKCDTAGADIYYTTDGSEPSKNSGTKYTSAISVSDTTTIKAIAVKDGMTDSSIASARYTINILGKVATPTFTPAAGTYTEAQNVEIKCDTAGADIYYTTDGSEPSKNSGTKYTSAISVSDTTTIKAIAVKDGMTDSSVASARYTISDTPVETCTIIFEPNGGKGDMDDQTVDKGVRTQLNKNKFTRSGYSFDGWNTDPDGDGTGYEDKDYITVQKDITLYAQWTNGGKDHDSDDDNHEEHKPASWELNPNEKQQLSIIYIGSPVGVCAGYQVQGEAARTLFNAATPAGWKEAFTFNLLNKSRVPEVNLKSGKMTLIIPSEYLGTGRQFGIIALDKNGMTYVLPDKDANPNTLTVSVNFEGYAMELIYMD